MLQVIRQVEKMTEVISARELDSNQSYWREVAIVKFASDGTFIKAWGRTGYGPGEFRTLHAIAIDSEGRIFVGALDGYLYAFGESNGKKARHARAYWPRPWIF